MNNKAPQGEEACEAYLHWLSGIPAELNAEKYEDLDFSDITSQYVSPWVGASGRVVTLEGQFTAAELRLIADRMEGKSQD